MGDFVLGGFCPGGFCPGGFCPGGCLGGFCPGTVFRTEGCSFLGQLDFQDFRNDQ